MSTLADCTSGLVSPESGTEVERSLVSEPQTHDEAVIGYTEDELPAADNIGNILKVEDAVTPRSFMECTKDFAVPSTRVKDNESIGNGPPMETSEHFVASSTR